jgi:hypothetical protein
MHNHIWATEIHFMVHRWLPAISIRDLKLNHFNLQKLTRKNWSKGHNPLPHE